MRVMAQVNGHIESNGDGGSIPVNEPHETFDTILVLDFG